MEKINFKLEIFEGPLDLMLHLISKHKLNINDIQISELLTQYLDYIERLKLADLEVASDFLACASHLVYIKTVSLLPKHEEADILKKELEGQLLEYKLCKEVALLLKQKFIGDQLFIRSEQILLKNNSNAYEKSHDKNTLLSHYLNALGRGIKPPPKQSLFTPIIATPFVSIKSRIIFILNKLYSNGVVPYDEFFFCDNNSERVATFLAMLELIKSKRIMVSEDNKYIVFTSNDDTI